MIEQLFVNVLEVTATVSPILLLLLLFSRRISHSYSAKWSYFVWLILAIRLMIPFNLSLPIAPVVIQVPIQISQSVTGAQTISAASSQTVVQSAATVSPTAPIIPASNGFSVIQIAAILWICGIILFLCFHFVGYFLFLRRVKHWRHLVTNPVIVEIFTQKRKEMHIQRKILLYRCNVIDSPMLVGFFKPMILMPDCSVTGEQLGIILAHELIHYKRHDLWYQLLLINVNALHWFNPFVYLMVRQADNDLELFCDEEVVKNRPTEFRQTYGEAIFVFLTQKIKNKTSFSTNFIGGSKAMKQRFVRIYDKKKKKHGFASMAIVLATTILTGVCVACTAKPVSPLVDTPSQPVSSVSEPASSALKSDSMSSVQTNSTKTNQIATNNTSKIPKDTTSSTSQEINIAQKTKDYLLNGQNNKSEAEKLQWSATFLNQVNIDSVYQKYISVGGKAGNIESFAEYLTQNAPIPNNWKELFEADLLKTYGEKPSRYQSLQNNLYQVFVKKNGSEVPYVTVNARTGYYHG